MRLLRRTLLLPFWLILLAGPHMWSWLQDLFGGVGNVFDRLKAFVQRALDDVIGWIEGVGKWSYGAVVDVLMWINRTGGWLIDTALSLADRVWHLENTVWNDVGHWIAREANSVYNWAVGQIQSVINWAAGELARIDRALVDQWNGLWREIYSPLRGAIDWVVDHFERAFSSLWERIEHATDWVGGFVADQVVRAVGPFLDVWHFVSDEVVPLWRRVAGWLRFLADHPLDWPWIILRQLADRLSGGFVKMVLGAMTREQGVVEDVIARWLSP